MSGFNGATSLAFFRNPPTRQFQVTTLIWIVNRRVNRRNKEAGDDPSKGAAYDEKADHRSWEAMKVFFAEIFSQ